MLHSNCACTQCWLISFVITHTHTHGHIHTRSGPVLVAYAGPHRVLVVTYLPDATESAVLDVRNFSPACRTCRDMVENA